MLVAVVLARNQTRVSSHPSTTFELAFLGEQRESPGGEDVRGSNRGCEVDSDTWIKITPSNVPPPSAPAAPLPGSDHQPPHLKRDLGPKMGVASPAKRD